MSDMTIEQFLDHHKAQPGFRESGTENYTSMQDAWAKLDPERLLWVATRTGVLTGRELRQFALACARRVQHLMTDPRSVAALDVLERHINGDATDEDLQLARVAADAAARDAARDAIVRVAAWDAVWAAWAAAAAAWTAERQWQSTWLRENAKPNFSK